MVFGDVTTINTVPWMYYYVAHIGGITITFEFRNHTKIGHFK